MGEKTKLKALAYYNTGGTAEKLYEPSDLAQLQTAMKEIKRSGRPYFFLGGGTNSLVTDEVWPGAVVSFHKMQKMELSPDHQLTVGAGIVNSDAAKFALEKGLAGIAWMNGLPGQIGGTVRMNARCYGGEISEVVTKVVTVDETGEAHEFTDPSVFRGYKDTVFMENGHAVAEAVIQLMPGDAAEIQKKMDFCRSDREAKGQYVYPTCGCVFKNDYSVGVPSGMMLERAGIKTLKHNGAEINPHHANFLYNVSADSRAIIEATLIMREKIYDTFGVWLEYEMEILGKLPDDLKTKVKEVRPHDFKLDKLQPLRDEFHK